MTQAIRQPINGITPQDIRKINDNMESIWEKVHGDLNFADNDKDLQTKIMTQYVPVQGEGNCDNSYSFDVRFYVPPNVKRVKSTSFNINIENYRMDSDIAMSNEVTVPVEISSTISTTSITATVEDKSQTSLVTEWGNYDSSGFAEVVTTTPPKKLAYSMIGMPTDAIVFESTGGNAPYQFIQPTPVTSDNLMKFSPCYKMKDQWGMDTGWYVDLSSIQHKHDTTHSHIFNQSPHGHVISGSVTLPSHQHPLREGIKVSTTPPQGIGVTLNGISIADMSYTNSSITDLNVKDYVKIGDWNKVTFTTTNLARIVLYGIIEIELKNI